MNMFHPRQPPLRTRLWIGVSLAIALTAATTGCSGSSIATSGSSPSAGPTGAAPGGTAPNGSCASAPAGTKVDLTYSSWIPGMDKAVTLWNSQNPDIQVKYTAVAAGNQGTYANDFNAIKAATSTDLGEVEFDTLPTFRVQDGLENIGSCPGVSAAKAQFSPWAWQQATFGENGALYAVPQDGGPQALYYRTDLFEKAGLTPPTTWDEYYQDALKIKAAGAYILNLPTDSPSSSWLASLVWQAGGQWFSTDGNSWKVSMTNAASAKVADFWQKMIDAKVLLTGGATYGTTFLKALNTGQVWTVIGAAWSAKLIETGAPATSGKWGVVQLPQWTAGQTTSGNWGGGTTVVFKGSKHPAEAAEFALWLNTNLGALALNNSGGGQYPTTITGQTDLPALSKPYPYFDNQNIWTVFKDASAGVSSNWIWGPTMVQTYADMSDGISKAVNGQGTLADAMKTAQDKTIAAMNSQAIPAAAG